MLGFCSTMSATFRRSSIVIVRGFFMRNSSMSRFSSSICCLSESRRARVGPCDFRASSICSSVGWPCATATPPAASSAKPHASMTRLT